MKLRGESAKRVFLCAKPNTDARFDRGSPTNRATASRTIVGAPPNGSAPSMALPRIAWRRWSTTVIAAGAAMLDPREPIELPPVEWFRDLSPQATPVPVWALPPPLQPWVHDASDRMWVPRDFFVGPLLTSLAILLGRRVRICPRASDPTYQVVPVLWGITIAQPGVGKSPASDQSLAFFRQTAARAVAEAEKGDDANLVELSELEARALVLERELARATKEGDEPALAEFLREKSDLKARVGRLQPRHPRFETNDATPEQLQMLVEGNPVGILLVRDELAGLFNTFRRAGREGERAMLLEAASGNGECRVDRIGRRSVHIRGACVGLQGTIQPAPFRDVVTNTGDGLLQRFGLLLFPDLPPGYQLVDRAPDARAHQRVQRIFDRFFDMDLGTRDGLEPVIFKFDALAQPLYDKWVVSHQRKLRAEFEGSDLFRSHLAKFPDLVVRLALVDHLCVCADADRVETTVGEASLTRALDLVAALTTHARKAYGLSRLSSIERAGYALQERILAGFVRDGMKVRDIYRANWSCLATRKDVLLALDELQRRHYLRVDLERRNSRVVRINNEILKIVDDPKSVTGSLA